MKKFLVKIALFFAIIAVIDFAFGKVCDYLRDHTKGGFSGNIHYICEESNEDIIMMGSSRMRHHYVPQVFEDSLRITCYNAGIDGNGIMLNYGFLKMILQRYTPELIIYDVAGFDMYKDDNTKYLRTLRHYYNEPGIAEITYDVDRMERWKCLSSLYRYNSALLGFIGDNLHPTQLFNKGYWPSYNVMDYVPKRDEKDSPRDVDSLKMYYVHKYVDLAKSKGIQLVFVASPTWFGDSDADYNRPIKDLCEREKVPFIDCYYDSLLCSNYEYWSDPIHLNDKGARLFSGKMTYLVRSYLEKTNLTK